MAWEFKSGSGIWTEYVDPETNKSTITEHKVKVIAEYCKPEDHYFKPVSATKRELECTKCGFITTYILGPQKLVKGKIITTKTTG